MTREHFSLGYSSFVSAILDYQVVFSLISPCIGHLKLLNNLFSDLPLITELKATACESATIQFSRQSLCIVKNKPPQCDIGKSYN